MATIVYDNDSPNLSFTPQTALTISSLDIYLGGTLTIASGLTMIAQGTSITLFGYLSGNISVIIDGERQSEVSREGQIVGVIYQSPILHDTMHNLTMTGPSLLSPLNLVNIDYATVVAGENTPLQGERLIVDESDPSVVFEGHWVQNTNSVLSNQDGSRVAYRNTTRQTSSFAASVTFQFNGTTVSVFGICSGSTEYQIYLDGTFAPFTSSFKNSTSFQWYQKDGLSSTNHTLKIIYLDLSQSSIFNLDYFIYTPSFTSLAEKEGLSDTSSSSQPPTTNTAIVPPISTSPSNSRPSATNSTTPLPDHNDISHATLLGIVIGPVVFGIIVILMLFFMRKKKLLFWSTRERRDTVNPFPPPHPQTQGLSQLRVYHKSGLTNGQTVVESQIPDEDLPLIDTSPRWWARLWRRSGPGTVEAFPPDWDSSSPRQPTARQKPALPTWHVTQQRASRQNDTSSTHETIVADPRVQELEDMVLALQQEIEETRDQDRSGAQNGALMRELIASRGETLIERGRQEQGDGGSVTVSTTVV